MFDKYPYTDFHEMNLDWIIKEMKDLVDEWDSFGGNVSATAYTSNIPAVDVSGDLKTGLAFNFGLVKGSTGPRGPQGEQGPQGPSGTGLEILDVYPTLTDLQTAHPTGSAGDAYLVGSNGSFTLYVWSDNASAWTNAGSLSSPSPSIRNPEMDGTASAGSSAEYSRADHVHPSDTAKLDKSANDGVYAVSNGQQVMLEYSNGPAANDLVQYGPSGEIAASSLEADSITITNNTILNSTKLEGVGGSTNAYQILSTLSSNMDVLALVSDTANNTPAIAFQGGQWGNNGQMTDASKRVNFTNSFVSDPSSYSETRIGLSPASASVLGGIKIGNGLRIDGSGVVSNVFSNLTSGSLNDITYNYQGYVANAVTDKPVSNGGGLCCCMSTTGTYGSQLFIPNSSSSLYFREMVNGVWGVWHQTDDASSGTETVDATYCTIVATWTKEGNNCAVYGTLIPKQDISSSSGNVSIPNLPAPDADVFFNFGTAATTFTNVPGRLDSSSHLKGQGAMTNGTVYYFNFAYHCA